MAEGSFQVLVTPVRSVDESNRTPRDLEINVSIFSTNAGIEFSKGALKVEQHFVHVIAVVCLLSRQNMARYKALRELPFRLCPLDFLRFFPIPIGSVSPEAVAPKEREVEFQGISWGMY
jgi:hypothetical protein